jgi:hypothetical protein
MSSYEEVDKDDLVTLMAQVITQGEIFDTRLYGRAVLQDLWQRGFDIVRVSPDA